MDDSHEIARAILGRHAEQGIALPDGSLAWSTAQCLEILDDLGATKVAVLGGEFFRAEPIGLVPAYDGWSCDRAPGENASEYALRSRGLAAHRVGERSHQDHHVVLQLSDQRHAA